MATAVAVLTSPALLIFLYDRLEWPLFWAIVVTVLGWARVICFCGVSFSAATSWLTRLLMSSPDPNPAELSPAIVSF